jgi:hypothetical protein
LSQGQEEDIHNPERNGYEKKDDRNEDWVSDRKPIQPVSFAVGFLW